MQKSRVTGDLSLKEWPIGHEKRPTAAGRLVSGLRPDKSLQNKSQCNWLEITEIKEEVKPYLFELVNQHLTRLQKYYTLKLHIAL